MHVLDTSAFLKLLLPERNHEALRAHLGDGSPRVASQLLRLEALRTVRRVASELLPEAERQLALIQLVPIDQPVLDIASELPPTELRSLDAIHLATALSLTDYSPSLITYDRQLAAAAQTAGIPVAAPGI